MIAADAGDQVLDRGLTRCQERGGLRARGTQRTDSTHVLAAMRPGNRLEGVGEAMADTLHSLLQVAPAWGRATLPADWLVR
jgi:transposase